LIATNMNAAPKRYFLFSSSDDTLTPSEKVLKKSNTQIKVSGYFSENIADSFFNEKLELGGVFSVRTPDPIMGWHPAKPGTAAKFHGCLSRTFPELDKISDEELDTLVKSMRDKE
jgi:hypothetical protein